MSLATGGGVQTSTVCGAEEKLYVGMKRGTFGGVDRCFAGVAWRSAFIYEHLHRVRAASRIVRKN